MASEVERLRDGAKMFRAVREMTRRPATQLTFHDDAGRIISNSTEINTRVTDHFSRQFTDPTVDRLDAFTGEQAFSQKWQFFQNCSYIQNHTVTHFPRSLD